MRKGWIAIVAFAAAGAMGTASADTITVTAAEGDIAVGNPSSKLVRGVSETSALGEPNTGAIGCTGDTSNNGIDGIVFSIPLEAGDQNAPAHLVTTGDTAVDVDVWWYTEDCTLVSAHEAWSTDLTTNVDAPVPYGAAYGVIDLSIGAAAHVKLTYELEVE